MNRIHCPFPTTLRLPIQIDFCGIQYDKDGYRVQVSEYAKANAKILEIDFGWFVIAQRSMDEGAFLNLSWEAEHKNSPAKCIAIVQNSSFLNWFHEESSGIYTNDNVQHIAILTQNEWVEVICSQLPKLKWL